MTDTKNPPAPATGCAPLDRPMAETVSLEVVWAAAYAAESIYRAVDPHNQTRLAIEAADYAVAALLAAHPRGVT